MVYGGFEWPLPRGRHLNEPLTPPGRAVDLPWTRNDLTPSQVLRKGEAIRAYRTQTVLLGRFMEAFERRNELLSPSALPPGPLGVQTSVQR